ncbi:MAG: helix-turn-helix domain-containing protein [Clostridia bacterium]
MTVWEMDTYAKKNYDIDILHESKKEERTMPVMISEMGMFVSLEQKICDATFLTILDRGLFQRDKQYSPRLHHHSYNEVFLIGAVEAVVATSSRDIRVPRHSMLFIPSEQRHSIRIDRKDSAQCISLRFSILSRMEKEGKNNDEKTSLFLQAGDIRVFSGCRLLLETLSAIRLEFLEERPMYLEKIDLLLKGFYIDMFRLMENSKPTPWLNDLDIRHDSLSGWKSAYVGAYKEMLFDFVECYADTLLSKTLTISEMATLLNISESLLKRVVKEFSSDTFGHFIAQRRMSAAREMIRASPERALNDIAEAVGYDSYTGFYQAFRHFTGITPAEYKMKQRKNENDV